jgi:RimJ/RimL family protein N-acetyltransferase
MPLHDVTTERLQLARWDASRHTSALEAINARAEAVRYLNAGVPYTAAETAAQSARFSAHWERFGFGLWAVSLRASGGASGDASGGAFGGAFGGASGASPGEASGETPGTTVGFVGLAHPLWFPELAAEVEVGWRLHPDAWGHGYATEAGHAALAAAPSLGLTRIIAVIDPANTPSLAVAGRLGLVHERTLPHPQRPGDVFVYAVNVDRADQAP